MKRYTTKALSVLSTLLLFAGVTARSDSMTSLAIFPSTGAVTLQHRWAIGPNLGGFHHMSQDLSLGGGANQFYSIKGTAIPNGGDTLAFYRYIAASGAATNHADIGSKLTPNSYSALTSADPDVGYGPVNFYFIHHKATGDYFSVIVPGSGTSSAVTDLKPMDGPGGPATIGASGYFGLTFAASNLGYGLNRFYYLRTDAVTGYTKFGSFDPGLAGASTDHFDLGIGGYTALAFTGADVGYGTDKMYYLRLDPVTGYSVLGMLDPGTGGTSDIANLGGIYTTLTFVPGDLGFGSGNFYTTGVYNPTWQSVSFAAIPDRALTDGSFTVAPSASSGLPITLTVLSGSATISAPVGGVFTVNPTAPGLIILQATQAGQVSPTAYESNMLRQSFLVTGLAVRTGGSVDFNEDGHADILWRNPTTGQTSIWFMNGTTRIGNGDLGTTSTAWNIVGTGDFNDDGQPDILWRNPSTGQISAWLMSGGVRVGNADLGGSSTAWEIVGTGDFNDDGRPDILWRNPTTGQISAWLMNGVARIGNLDLGTASTAWMIYGTGDFNDDGLTDILWRNPTTGQTTAWLMNGAARIGNADLGTASTAWEISSTGDFNNDGQTDILWRNPSTGQISAWLMNGATRAGNLDLGTASTAWQIVP